jgi:Cytochrome C and Quinol oxidase polypeptide I
MYGGRIVYATPILWSIGFMVTFVIGGMTGVLLAVPPADFVLHNSLFLVVHFHNVIIGGVWLPPLGMRVWTKKQLILNWVVRDVYDGMALVERPRGSIKIAAGQCGDRAGLPAAEVPKCAFYSHRPALEIEE